MMPLHPTISRSVDWSRCFPSLHPLPIFCNIHSKCPVRGPRVARRRRPSPLRRDNGAGQDPGLEDDWKINTAQCWLVLLCWGRRYSRGLECTVGFNGLDNPSLSLSSRSRCCVCATNDHITALHPCICLSRRPPAELSRHVSIYTVLRNFTQKVHFRKCGGPINSIHLRLSSL